jgi:hypothetical protein
LDAFNKIAKDNTPPNVSVCYIDVSESQPVATYDADEIRVPRPDSMENLLTYLHECAHFFLHRTDETTPRYLKEFQAEIWALDKMRAAGITVPDELVLDSKKRLANDIRGAVRNRVECLDRRAFEFARPYFQDFELEELSGLVSG